MGSSPQPTFGAVRAPIVDKNGYPSFPFLKKLQEWETKLRQAINTAGSIVLSNAVGILAKANGGTGTTTPGDTAGAGIALSGTWPNETIGINLALATPGGTIDGVNKTFTISKAPTNTGTILWFWNGQLLSYTDDFTVSSTNVTMVVAPSVGDNLRYLVW